jgi:hypothetical protein
MQVNITAAQDRTSVCRIGSRRHVLMMSAMAAIGFGSVAAYPNDGDGAGTGLEAANGGPRMNTS